MSKRRNPLTQPNVHGAAPLGVFGWRRGLTRDAVVGGRLLSRQGSRRRAIAIARAYARPRSTPYGRCPQRDRWSSSGRRLSSRSTIRAVPAGRARGRGAWNREHAEHRVAFEVSLHERRRALDDPDVASRAGPRGLACSGPAVKRSAGMKARRRRSAFCHGDADASSRSPRGRPAFCAAAVRSSRMR